MKASESINIFDDDTEDVETAWAGPEPDDETIIAGIRVCSV